MRLFIITLVLNFIASSTSAQGPAIKVDQFGYLPSADKVAILIDPQLGYNDSDSYTPGPTIELKDATNGAVVFSTSPSIWNGGATHAASGDKAWWFDFSSYITPGEYYIYDPSNTITSDTFLIDDDVYDDVFKLAFKSFYYQRCGVEKALPHCLPGYVDTPCHVGGLQDLNCRSIITQDAASEKDLSGGWHDAGDYNKYVNFLWKTMIDLLLSYEYNPDAWSDDMDIPESGNYIPDLLDEIKVETDWLLKMQQTNGSVLSIVGVTSGSASPPSSNSSQRYYGPATTSASFTAATVFALAAKQFLKINCPAAQTYAAVLETAAEDAYSWAVSNPNVTYNNSGNVGAGEQETDQYGRDMRQLTAAIYLYDLTSSNTYKTYVETNYVNAHMIQWHFVYPFENAIQQSLVYYAHLTGVDPTHAGVMISRFKNSVDNTGDNYPAHINGDDAYRAFMSDNNHGWGSNGVKMDMANIFQSYRHFDLDPTKNATLNNIMLSYAHYNHGCNPNGLVYLTNLNDYHAERSINSIYHNWFTDGSALWDEVGVSTYGPAPGFLSGGPNPGWSLDGCCPSNCGSTQNNNLCIDFMPPGGQPILKSYKDWNGDWPQNSWSVTENAIYYQASYLSLLSSQVDLVNINIMSSEASTISNGDLLVSGLSRGIILSSRNDSTFLITINNAGEMIATASSNVISGSSQLQNNYLNISGNSDGFILRSANGDYWRVSIDTDGKISINATTPPIAGHIEQTIGDFIISEKGHGLIMKNPNNDCYLIKINDAGNLIAINVSCI